MKVGFDFSAVLCVIVGQPGINPGSPSPFWTRSGGVAIRRLS